MDRIILAGTRIVTVCAKVYKKMRGRLGERNVPMRFGYVNHSKGEFVGFADKSHYTNTVENGWMSLKRGVKSHETNEMLDLYLAEFLYTKNFLERSPRVSGPNFRTFLMDIAHVYPGAGRTKLDLVERLPAELQNPMPGNTWHVLWLYVCKV